MFMILLLLTFYLNDTVCHHILFHALTHVLFRVLFHVELVILTIPATLPIQMSYMQIADAKSVLLIQATMLPIA